MQDTEQPQGPSKRKKQQQFPLQPDDFSSDNSDEPDDFPNNVGRGNSSTNGAKSSSSATSGESASHKSGKCQDFPAPSSAKRSRPSYLGCADDDLENHSNSSNEAESSMTEVNPGVIKLSREELSKKEVISILKAAEKGKYSGNIIANAPIQPKAGSLFLYQKKSGGDKRYLQDQYFGLARNARKTLEGGLVKTYYVLKLRKTKNAATGKADEGSSTVKNDPSNVTTRDPVNFRKLTYWLLNAKAQPAPFVLIHYLGDEKLFVPQSHGNSKTDQPFTKTSEEMKEKIKALVRDHEAAPKKIYEKLVREHYNEAAEGPLQEAGKYEKIDTPRNTEQIRNFKKASARKKRISKCEITSMYDLATSDLANFVLKIELVPFAAMFAEPTVLNLANKLLQLSNKDRKLPQLLSYDTTFELGDAYVSILVMRNIFLHADPVFPVAFMIHDRKIQDVHWSFWEVLKRAMNLQPLLEGVPICTDREDGIVGAIKTAIPGIKLISCNNHIQRDVKIWVNKHGGKKDDEFILSKQVMALLDCDTHNGFTELLDVFKLKWSKAFRKYYEEFLEEDVISSANFNIQQFEAFARCTPTNNISESLNLQLKYNSGWKELPLDALALKIITAQCFYLCDFDRASRNLGNYRLKKEYRGHADFTPPSYMYFTEEGLAASVRKSVDVDKVVQPDQLVSKEDMAKLCINQRMIFPVAEQPLWVIRSPYRPELIYDVTRNCNTKSNKREFICTCHSPVMCWHVLAVKISIGDVITEEIAERKLSVLRKNARGFKGKLGRKKPYPLKLIANVVEADDSELAARKEILFEAELNDVPDSPIDYDADFKHPPACTSKYLPISTRKQKLQATLEDDNNEFEKIFLRELLPEIKNEEKLFKNYSTLKKGWIEGSLIDKIILQIISKYSITNVLYVGEVLFRTVRDQSSLHHVAHYSHDNDGLNKDVILTCVSSPGHWMLGAIILRTKTICLFDTLFHSTRKDERKESFECLLKIAHAVYATAATELDSLEWKLLYASDVPRQNDGTECGVNVCLMAYGLLQQIPLPSTRAIAKEHHLRNRKWMLHVLESFKPDSNVVSTRRLPPKEKKFVADKQIDIVVIDGDIVITNCVILVRDGLKGCDGNWTLCNESVCPGDEEHIDKQILCVMCRKWFHQSCLNVVPSKLSYYFKCKSCEYAVL